MAKPGSSTAGTKAAFKYGFIALALGMSILIGVLIFMNSQPPLSTYMKLPEQSNQSGLYIEISSVDKSGDSATNTDSPYSIFGATEFGSYLSPNWQDQAEEAVEPDQPAPTPAPVQPAPAQPAPAPAPAQPAPAPAPAPPVYEESTHSYTVPAPQDPGSASAQDAAQSACSAALAGSPPGTVLTVEVVDVVTGDIHYITC